MDNCRTEIIEFPAFLLNSRTGQIEDSFHSLIKPVINPILTEFCTKLTGISQDDVNKAPRFIEVFKSFEKWLEKHRLTTEPGHSFAILTDGPWDLARFLKNQCAVSSIENY